MEKTKTMTKKVNVRPKRIRGAVGENIYWFVVDIFETQEKVTLLKRELYRFASQIQIMHPETFENVEQVRCFIKRHTFSKKVGFSSQTPPKRRRMKIYRKVFQPKISPTAHHLYTKNV